MGISSKNLILSVNPTFSSSDSFRRMDANIAIGVSVILAEFYQLLKYIKNWYSPSFKPIKWWWTSELHRYCCVVHHESDEHALGGLYLKLTQSLWLVAIAGYEAFNLLSVNNFDTYFLCLQTCEKEICYRELNRNSPEEPIRNCQKMIEANKVSTCSLSIVSKRLSCYAPIRNRELKQGSIQLKNVRLSMFSRSYAKTLIKDFSVQPRDRAISDGWVNVYGIRPVKLIVKGTKFRGKVIVHNFLGGYQLESELGCLPLSIWRSKEIYCKVYLKLRPRVRESIPLVMPVSHLYDPVDPTGLNLNKNVLITVLLMITFGRLKLRIVQYSCFSHWSSSIGRITPTLVGSFNEVGDGGTDRLKKILLESVLEILKVNRLY